MDELDIGDIGNYYGGLSIKCADGKFYWGIQDWDDDFGWQEIPEYLFYSLKSFEENRIKENYT